MYNSTVTQHASVDGIITGNVRQKYLSKNPLERILVNGFVQTATRLIAQIPRGAVLDAGCGEGTLGAILLPNEEGYTGFDIDIESAQRAYPNRKFLQGDLTQLPFPDNAFDLVIACEVLEHLPNPQQAVAELHRVCRSHALVSVPWEPTWRAMNLLRGAYWNDWGNTPGHVQHFSRTAFRDLARPHFRIVEERHPFPWTMVLLKKVS